MKQMSFGGDWTQDKLERVRKYLVAYVQIMKNRRFRFAYIDAFAGTGYQTVKRADNPNLLLLPELVEPEPKAFLDGSARIALQVEPPFTKYIFVEKDDRRFLELAKLSEEFPQRKNDIILVNADANSYLTDLCQNYNWSRNRAVLFLDPFGMQVNWETIIAIANTKAIDLWYLFPLGVAVNRLLKKDGNIDEILKQKLNQLFGETNWQNVFYETVTMNKLFGEEAEVTKIANFDLISRYFVQRLKTIFSGVAENPLPMRNSKNNPLYLLSFAAANNTAVKIAQDILRR